MKHLDKLLGIFCIFVILHTGCSDYIDDECDSFKAKYLNDKMRHLLGENHRIVFTKLQLEETYNGMLHELQSALIRKPKRKDSCIKAERALKKFKEFMREFTDLKSIIEPLLKKLKRIEKNSNLDTKNRFEAFRLTLILEDSATVDAAKNNIQSTKEFLNRILGAANAINNENTHETENESILELLKMVADALDKLEKKVK